MAGKLNVVALLGSLRAKSFNRMLLATALELAPAGLAISEHGGLDALPFFNQDIEDAGDPESVTKLKAALAAADALLLVSPEYNSGTSAVLKNAIDWGTRGKAPLKGMPTALMSASPSPLGGARMQGQLRLTFSGFGGLVMPAPDVLLMNAGQRFDASGKLTDEATRKVIGDHLARFEAFARMIRGKAA